jgi:signal transduction histidine kinase
VHRLFGSRLEIAFSVGLVAWAVTEAIAIDSAWSLPVRLAVALAANLPLAVRHRFPYAVAAWAVVVFVADGLLTFLPYQAVTPLEGLGVALFAIAAYGRDRRTALRVLSASAALPFLFLVTEREVSVTSHDMLALAIMQLLATGAGWAVRARREEAEREAEREASAGAARAARLRDGLAAERRRIARELHAIVTRDLAATARLAALARTRLDDGRDDALVALDAIAGTTRAALDELRRLLHVLRADEGAAAGAGGGPVAVAGGAAASGAVAGSAVAGGMASGAVAGGAVASGAVAGGGGGGARGAATDGAGRDEAERPVRARPLADALFAGLALLTLAIELLVHDGRPIGFASGLLLIVLPLLALRSRAGFAVACLLAIGGLWGRTVLDWMPNGGASLLPVIVFGPYAAAAFARDGRRAVAGGVVALVFSVGAIAWMPGRVWTDVPIVATVVAFSWSAGWYVRGSTSLASALRLDGSRRDAAAPAQLHAALDSERRRVARDLHDAVAHGISLVGLLAGAARATVPRDPQQARGALDDLDAALASTRVELARLLEALRAGEEPADDLTVDDLDAVVAHARRSGQEVDLQLDRAALAQAPASARASACRIVQEALTNARKHAAGCAVSVAVFADGGELSVEVVNGRPPRGPQPCGEGARRGIEGMRERARLLGGELDAAPCAGGGFAVRARLPLVAEPAERRLPAERPAREPAVV